LKIRRREPPGRSDGDRSKSRRDQGKAPGRREAPPSRGKRSPTQTDKPAPRSRPKPGGPREPSSGGSGGTGSLPPRGPRREARERTPAPAVPVLARTGRELLYGRNAVLEALRGRRGIERLFVAEGAREDERLRGLMRLATERGVEIERIPRLMLDDATRGANHQGIALEAEPYRYAVLEDLLVAPGTVLVLDHLQDPQNVGTLFRAGEAAGVAGVVIPEDRAAEVTPAVVNASAGAVEHLRVAPVPNLVRALEALKGSGRWVAGLDAGATATNIFTTEIPTPAVLVVGAEGTGLGMNLRKHCDLLLALPMRGQVDSLNAATAGAIAIYELLRREDGGLKRVRDNAERSRDGVAGDEDDEGS
jgi:23S rRNA (guanosine2251-2'-O)-methyltransferase